jgi:ABC-type transport system involved in multi-copper enzyme maturation permease subunit
VLEIAKQILPPGMLTNQLEFLFAGYFFCVAIMFVIGILIAVWVYRDAQSRGMSGALWLIIVILTSWIGLIIYLVVRSPKVAPPPAPYGAMAPPPAYGAPPPPPAYGAPPPGYGPPPGAPPQQMATNCRYCGAPLPPGAMVCPRCGGRL